jgi:hypothetical protein
MAKDILAVEVNGAKHKLFMSWGLKNQLVNYLGSNGQMATAAIDPESRETVLKLCLTKKGKSGCIEGEVDFDNIDLPEDSAIAIIEWAQEHVFDFLLKAAEVTKRLGEKYDPKIQNSILSQPGLSPSASTTESAGPSDASQAS